MASRKVEALRTLADHDKIRSGDRIELIPKIRSSDAPVKVFQATILNPRKNRESIQWDADNQLFSLTDLTKHIKTMRYGSPDVGKITANWRRVGSLKTLREEAEEYPR